MAWSAAEEGRHAPSSDPWWTEQWWFGAWTAELSAGCHAALTLLPNQRRAWYWCALLRAGRPLLAVVDLDQPLPSTGLRVRAGSLWADHQCEDPFEQWTVLNETYGVEVDDPAEMLGRGHGLPTAVAFDLEWYAGGPASAVEGGYEQPGEVHGVVELRGGNLTLEGPAHRRHVWGDGAVLLPMGIPGDGAEAPVRIALDGTEYALRYTLGATGWHLAVALL